LPFLEGLSVDEAFTLFDDGFGVKKSKEMRREKIEMQNTYNAEGLHAGLIEEVYKYCTSSSPHNSSIAPTVYGSHPPSTLYTCPVVYDAASLSRKTTVCATSSGVPTRGITVSGTVGPP
jgi:hypothetical protein